MQMSKYFFIRQNYKKELKKQKKAARNFHYNILGGPSYTPDFGLLIGGSALMTFRMNPKDTEAVVLEEKLWFYHQI